MNEFKTYDSYFNFFEEKEFIANMGDYSLYLVTVDGENDLITLYHENVNLWKVITPSRLFISQESIDLIKGFVVDMEKSKDSDEMEEIKGHIEVFL